jgi:hypothetical protein
MTEQPTLFPQDKPVSPQSSYPSQEPVSDRTLGGGRQTPPWLVFLELSVRVIVRLYMGLVLVVLPWTHFWSDNRLLLLVPHLSAVALSGAARGVISGLGLLNLWIGIDDAIHFRQR